MAEALAAASEGRPLGRMARKRVATRAKLLESAYGIMLDLGVEAATIKDITDRADLGFGTFYNYFESKDDLAAQILDCIINDLAQRNVTATADLRRSDPWLVVAVSTRLVLRDAATNPIWAWWATRTDLLVDRLREGLLPFARSDILAGLARGELQIDTSDIDAIWSLAVWLMVGGIHDILLGLRPPESEAMVASAIMRMLGVAPDAALIAGSTTLPVMPPTSINWTFHLKRPEKVQSYEHVSLIS